MRQGSVRNLQLNPRFNQLGSHFVFELKARAEHVSLAKVAQTFVAAKNFHLTLLRSFLPSLPSLLLLLLRTLLTPCWPILKVQPKFWLPSCPHEHRMQINIQYTSCNDTHRAHSHTHTHILRHTVALQHVALQDKVLPLSLYVLGSHSVSWLFNCFLSLHFDFLLQWVAQLFAACCKFPPSEGAGGGGGESRVVYFYYIVVRLPQLAEKVCNFILNSLPPPPIPYTG